MELRQYQTKAVDKLRDCIKKGKKKPIMCLPCGAGKSVIFGRIIQLLVENGKTALWIVHRRNLVFQMQNVLKEFYDIDAGIIMAGVESDTDKPVQLCTIQSYRRRLDLDIRCYNRFFINADVVMIDEAHRSISKSYRSIIEMYYDKIVIGCTATPARADGRGMGEIYNALLDIISIKELTELEYLSPVRYFVPNVIDLEGVKIQMGDYQVKSLSEKTNTKKLIGDIVDNWLRVAENRKTLVFCVNVKHSIAVCEAFNQAGIKADHLDARSTDEEREATFQAMERGDITVLTNVALYQEGLDVPSVSCVVMARPTKSMGLYRQCVGRGLRIEEGKENCIVLDHGNVIEEHGLLEEDIIWSLDRTKKAWEKREDNKADKQPSRCRACGEVFTGTSICPTCGTKLRSFGKPIETVDAELVELKDKKRTNRNMSVADKRRLMGALIWHADKKGYKPGWAAWSYKSFTGVWPNAIKDVMAIEPEGEIKNLLTHILIKKAKSYQKARQA
ncbi:DEAD/DEAH box helicase family protein [bacterium]|nr:DEAD/DEAH box helicase family protein [bacterium]